MGNLLKDILTEEDYNSIADKAYTKSHTPTNPADVLKNAGIINNTSKTQKYVPSILSQPSNPLPSNVAGPQKPAYTTPIMQIESAVNNGVKEREALKSKIMPMDLVPDVIKNAPTVTALNTTKNPLMQNLLTQGYKNTPQYKFEQYKNSLNTTINNPNASEIEKSAAKKALFEISTNEKASNNTDFLLKQTFPTIQQRVNNSLNTVGKVLTSGLSDITEKSRRAITDTLRYSDTEKNTLDYLKNNDPTNYQTYKDLLDKTKNQQATDVWNSNQDRFTKEHPKLSKPINFLNAASQPVIGGVTGATEGIKQIGKNIFTGKNELIDTNKGGLGFIKQGENARENLEKNMGAKSKLITDAAIGLTQNLMTLPLGPSGAMAVNGLIGGTPKLIEDTERGISPVKAVIDQAVATATTMATDKIGIDSIFTTIGQPVSKNIVKNILTTTKNIAKQAGIEALEEELEELINQAWDLTNGDKSQFMLDIKNNMANGMDENEATAQAYYNVCRSVLDSAIVGGISGGMMGGASSAIGGIANRNNIIETNTNTATETNTTITEDTPKIAEDNQSVTNNKNIDTVDKPIDNTDKTSPYYVDRDIDGDIDLNDNATISEIINNRKERTELGKAVSEKVNQNLKENSNYKIISDRLYENGRKAYLTNLEKADNKTNFTKAFKVMYESGLADYSLQEAKKINEPILSFLNDDVRERVAETSYYAGQNDIAEMRDSQRVNNKITNKVKRTNGNLKIETNTKVSKAVANGLSELAKATKTDIVITDGRKLGDNVNGLYKDGTIYISSDSDKPYAVIANHEATHSLKENSYEAYMEYENYVIKKAMEVDEDAYISKYNEIVKASEDNNLNLTEDEIREEIAADLSEKFLQNEENIKSFIKEKPSLAKKVVEVIKSLARKFKNMLTKGDKSYEYNDTKLLGEYFNEAEKKWLNALANVEKNETVISDNENNKNSLKISAMDRLTTNVDTLVKSLEKETTLKGKLNKLASFTKRNGYGNAYEKSYKDYSISKKIQDIAKDKDLNISNKKEFTSKANEIFKDVNPVDLVDGNSKEIQQKVQQFYDLVKEYSREKVNIDTGISEAYDHIKNTKIYVDEKTKADLGKDNWQEIRKSNPSKFVTDKSKGIAVDSLWVELSDKYPAYFDENITANSDQLKALTEFLAQAKNERNNFTTEQSDAFKQYLLDVVSDAILESPYTHYNDNIKSALEEFDLKLAQEYAKNSKEISKTKLAESVAGLENKIYKKETREAMTRAVRGLNSANVSPELKSDINNILTLFKDSDFLSKKAKEAVDNSQSSEELVYKESSKIYEKIVKAISDSDINSKDTDYRAINKQLTKLNELITKNKIYEKTNKKIKEIEESYANGKNPVVEKIYRRDISENVFKISNDLMVNSRKDVVNTTLKTEAQAILSLVKDGSFYSDNTKNNIADFEGLDSFEYKQTKEIYDKISQELNGKSINDTDSVNLYTISKELRKLDRIVKNNYMYEKGESKLEKYKESREETRQKLVYRNSIKRGIKNLSTSVLQPTKQKHISSNLHSGVVEFLGLFNETGINDDIKTTKINKIIEKLKVAQSEGNGLVDPMLENNIESLKKIVGNEVKPLNKYNSKELSVINNAVMSVLSVVNNENKLFADTKQATLSAVADRVTSRLNKRKDTKNRKNVASDFVNYTMAEPSTVFEKAGLEEQYIALEKAEGEKQKRNNIIIKEVTNTMEILDSNPIKAIKKVWELMGVRKKDLVDYKNVKVSRGQLLSLLISYEREQGKGHILNGGVTFEAQKALKQSRNSDVIKITEADITEIKGMFSENELKFAHKMRDLLDIATEWLNNTYETMFGYRPFQEKNYYTLKTDSRYNKTNRIDIEEGNVWNGRKLENIGFTKNTVEGASNPIVISDIFSTVLKHLVEANDYASYVKPLSDIERITKYTNKENADFSMKGLLEKKIGKGGVQYINKFLVDMNMNAKNEVEATISQQLMSKAKRAMIAGNLRVVIQQPTAYFRAGAILDADCMALSPSEMLQAPKEYKRMVNEKYGLVLLKDRGYSEMGTTRSVREEILGNSNFIDNAVELAMKPAGVADAVTWGALSICCKKQILKEHKGIDINSKEFRTLHEDLMNEIIRDTQVCDSIIYRTAGARSANGFNAMEFSFMSEPLKTVNLFLKSADKLLNVELTTAERKIEQKKLLKRTVAVGATAVVNKLIVSLFIDAWRDKDEENNYFERVFKNFFGLEDNFKDKSVSSNLVSVGKTATGGLLNYIPYLNDVMSIIDGYDVERLDMSALSTLVKNTKRLVNWGVQKAQGDEPTNNGYYVVSSFINGVAQTFGIPLTNIQKDTNATIRACLAMLSSVGIDTSYLDYERQKMFVNLKNSKNWNKYVELYMKEKEEGHYGTAAKIKRDLAKYGVNNKVLSTREKTLKKKKEKEEKEKKENK